MFEFLTKAASPLCIGLATALAVLFLVNRSLSNDLDKERAEKTKALLTISTLELRINKINALRKADSQATKDILDHMELYNEINTNTALALSHVPCLEQKSQGPNSKAFDNKSNAIPKNSTKNHQTGALSCSRKGQTSCNIDVPLPSLSAPLVLLYNKLSNATGVFSSSMAYGNKTSARSANHGDERPTAGAVGKGTSRHNR